MSREMENGIINGVDAAQNAPTWSNTAKEFTRRDVAIGVFGVLSVASLTSCGGGDFTEKVKAVLVGGEQDPKVVESTPMSIPTIKPTEPCNLPPQNVWSREIQPALDNGECPSPEVLAPYDIRINKPGTQQECPKE